jgi:hypothetical protein
VVTRSHEQGKEPGKDELLVVDLTRHEVEPASQDTLQRVLSSRNLSEPTVISTVQDFFRRNNPVSA